MSNDNKFNYTYVAPTEQERREIESIRRQYMPENDGDDAIERLRKLDGKVKRAPTALGIILGVLGVLVFGLGLTLILEWKNILLGVIVAVVGAVIVASAYPLKMLWLKRNKRKYGEEILALSDEILSSEKN